jgi:glycosyltransferase involved in cell wall biosynthesis
VTPRISVVVTAHNEGTAIVPHLDRILEAVHVPVEVLVVYDSADDTTAPVVEHYAEKDERIVPTLNTYGKGPARAIKYGIHQARADVVVVTMADGCDDPSQIEELARLVERGVVVAAASRYMGGGQQVGGPRLKGSLSRLAGLTLWLFGGVGTRDATNSYKAYAKEFVEAVGIDSDAGFEVGIELVAKARRLRRPVAEIPTIWLDRAHGQSNFKLTAWIPRYVQWYLFSFGPKLTVEQLAAQMSSRR